MKKLILAAVIISMSIIAYSQAYETKAMTGLIFGLNAGYASGFDKEENISTIFFSRDIKSGNVNFGGFIGYDYAINKIFSFGTEIDLNYTPNIYTVSLNIPAAGNLTRKYSTLNLPFLITAKTILPIGINLFIKGGINYQRLSSSVTTCSNKLCDNNSDRVGNNWNGVFAAGIGYQINKFNIFAQYMYIAGNTLSSLTENTSLSQSNITGGLSYTFPM